MQNEDGPDDLRVRTKQYALRIIKCYSALPKETVAQVLGRQLLRSGTSVERNIAKQRGLDRLLSL